MLDLMETMAESAAAATISSKGTRIRFAPSGGPTTRSPTTLRYAAQTTIRGDRMTKVAVGAFSGGNDASQWLLFVGATTTTPLAQVKTF